MKILDVIWFSGTNCVGIVKVEDEYDGIKYYISAVNGLNEEADMQRIADWGATFPKETGDFLFARHGRG